MSLYTVKRSRRGNGDTMGFASDIQRFAGKTDTKLQAYEDAVIDSAYQELERRLSERLPEETPVWTGRLRDSYLFERSTQGLRVSSNLAYAKAAIFRTTQDRNAEAMILRVAQEVVHDGAWLARVQARALARAR